MDDSRALRSVAGASEVVRTSSNRGPELRQMSSRAVGDSSCCRHGHQLDHPNKVVGGCDQVSGQSSLLQAAVTRPSEATHGFHPAEDLFNGLFTKDKFCWSRAATLRLKWWRRALGALGWHGARARRAVRLAVANWALRSAQPRPAARQPGGPLLEPRLRRQLHHECRHWHTHGVPVVNQLGPFLGGNRQHHCPAPGHGGRFRVLPGVGLLLFGERRLDQRVHWLASILVWVCTWVSGFFIATDAGCIRGGLRSGA
jgi:hypothetical protein